VDRYVEFSLGAVRRERKTHPFVIRLLERDGCVEVRARLSDQPIDRKAGLRRLGKNEVRHRGHDGIERPSMSILTRVENGRSAGRIVALLTDFGTADPFVGVMKAVIWGRCPGASIVDLTHAVSPQNVVEGAFWLERTFKWFGAGSVFVAVVDPGVGTDRRALVVEAHDRVFVGPDNGLLAASVLSDAQRRVYEIDVVKAGLPAPSRTFHGRDVFAPVAAEIAQGRIRPSDFALTRDLAPSPVPELAVLAEQVEGTVVTVDRFGNLITNITAESIATIDRPCLRIADLELPIRETYSDVAPGHCLALLNAFDTVEVAQRDGSAAALLNLGRGASALVRRGAR
jgi:S-adenosyl-L-methionine hydrolase (adenosine-forming)